MNLFGIGGNLVRQPEIGHTGQKDFVNFSIAHNHSKENVSFFDCVSWHEKIVEKLVHAETGQRVEISGWLKQERWESKEGKKRNKVKLVVEKLQTWPKKAHTSNHTTATEKSPSERSSRVSAATGGGTVDPKTDMVEDIFK